MMGPVFGKRPRYSAIRILSTNSHNLNTVYYRLLYKHYTAFVDYWLEVVQLLELVSSWGNGISVRKEIRMWNKI